MAKEGKPFLIVADDFGQHPAVNRGVYKAADARAITGADLIVVDVMSTTQQVQQAVRTLRRDYPAIGLGLHVNIFPDITERVSAPEVFGLLEQRDNGDLLRRLIPATRQQLAMFRETTGDDPENVSTHDHAHMDLAGNVFPQFAEILGEEGLDLSAASVRGIHTLPIRHARATTLLQGEPPKTPEVFRRELVDLRNTEPRTLELIAHPGDYPKTSEDPFESDFTLEARVRDLEGLIQIVDSDVIYQA